MEPVKPTPRPRTDEGERAPDPEVELPWRFRVVEGVEREQVIADLHAVADYLNAHPELPISPYGGLDVVFFASGDDQAQERHVAEVAEAMGVGPRREGEHFIVQRSFGRSAYRVVAIPAEARARHEALMTYRSNFTAH